MALLHFLRGYMPIFIQYRDHVAAKRAGQVSVLLARKRAERRRAVRGR